MTRSSDDLQRHLDELAGRSRRFLDRWHLERDLRVTCRDALIWLVAAPAGLLLLQAVLALTGQSPLPAPLWVWAALAVLGPVVSVAGRVVWLRARRHIDRRTSLRLFDTQLDTKGRLVTADEFLVAGERAGNTQTRQFIQAAIEDAVPYVQSALGASLERRPLPEWQVSRRSWLAVPATVVIVVLAALLGRVPGAGADPDARDNVMAAAALDLLPVKLATKLVDVPGLRPREARQTEKEDPEENDSRPSSESSDHARRAEQDADGQSNRSGQANSRSTSEAQSNSGTASNQKTPSKDNEEAEPREPQKSAAPQQAKKSEAKKPEEQQATTATTGQGQSKSSSSDTSNIPSEQQPDRAGSQKEADADKDTVQDEVEEEKTSGVERPTLRKNKPPVDRNLSPRPSGDGPPPPTVNGRSGPGGQKKTRGVPAMVLGVPIPDRIHGQTNPGRSKVTQEYSIPKEEPNGALTAEARQARAQAFGHVEHPQLSPWMQRLVEKYFTRLREAEGIQ